MCLRIPFFHYFFCMCHHSYIYFSLILPFVTAAAAIVAYGEIFELFTFSILVASLFTLGMHSFCKIISTTNRNKKKERKWKKTSNNKEARQREKKENYLYCSYILLSFPRRQNCFDSLLSRLWNSTIVAYSIRRAYTQYIVYNSM